MQIGKVFLFIKRSVLNSFRWVYNCVFEEYWRGRKWFNQNDDHIRKRCVLFNYFNFIYWKCFIVVVRTNVRIISINKWKLRLLSLIKPVASSWRDNELSELLHALLVLFWRKTSWDAGFIVDPGRRSCFIKLVWRYVKISYKTTHKRY